ncbi:glucosaminidase domain-containing protein [Myroides sp. LoEW2-1]|uniref:glucosaminidase domain-containing protein n=1 Tax=Myroides sp. LoEW2-1 TaxID=2683192 RepID=UPI001325311D|nr:glucosaminidase domain-containing protein [Myroides sp. LoEW2-1]MVX35489.1 LysM peptidoglycan-binding domain-containing protein [Myroides sp. LoEW2-1]
MLKKVLLLTSILLLVSCGSKRSTLSGKKVRTKELVSKEQYRADLRKKEEHKQTKTTEYKRVTSNSDQSQVLDATSSVVVTTDLIQNYILTYKGIAQDNMVNHGIPASITLAQGVLESGSGQGTLSRNANNHFGIKCHKGWEGPSVRHTDDAPDECFRKYDSPTESYRDHSMFLVGRSRYSDLFTLPKDDYKGWARGLKKAGYATDPKYADKLISLIERYSLSDYDKEMMDIMGLQSGVYEDTYVETQPVIPQTKVTTSSKKSHVVKKGDTLYSISKKYNMTVSELQKMNKMSGTALSIGQILKIK